MQTYKDFYLSLLKNYLIGSIVAIFGAGSLIVLSTLSISNEETVVILSIMAVALCSCAALELIVFTRHLAPIKAAFSQRKPSLHTQEKAFHQAQMFPELTFKRIMGPHFLGSTVPAISLAYGAISAGYLSVPLHYLFIAALVSFIITCMHAIIEFFLASKAIKPLLKAIRSKTLLYYHHDLALGQSSGASLRKKVLYCGLYIGAFPLLLFSLATQLQLTEAQYGLSAEYWSWAAGILIVSFFSAYGGAYLLFQGLIEPINLLHREMKSVGRGKTPYINEIYTDEFSELVGGFNKMVLYLNEREQKNRELLDGFFKTLAFTLDAKDPYTAGHSVRVAEYSALIAKCAAMPEDQIEQLKNSALLHDIGKIGIKDSILLKEGRLTEEEFNEIKKHPVIGAQILAQSGDSETIAPLIPGVKYHHERYDGQGYPEGLSGERIPVFGRIMAVADAFDAMTSDRPYRRGMNAAKALSILADGRGKQWDPYFADIFISEMKKSKNLDIKKHV
ncbi:HD-GYP domain-containing protein [Metabacillus lacus]|nr:HD-GYP domain-containing protein [Metabacillus lacus]